MNSACKTVSDPLHSVNIGRCYGCRFVVLQEQEIRDLGTSWEKTYKGPRGEEKS